MQRWINLGMGLLAAFGAGVNAANAVVAARHDLTALWAVFCLAAGVAGMFAGRLVTTAVLGTAEDQF